MFYTVPLAAFGLFRYIYIVKEGKGDPTEALLKDTQILVTSIVWAGMIGLIIYQ
jgi:4-hydroxybenzoate polyprenyltransferase